MSANPSSASVIPMDGAPAISPPGQIVRAFAAGAPKAAPSVLDGDGYVRQSQLIPAIIPFSSSTLWRKVKSGEFPAPVKLTDSITAWRTQDIRAWMAARGAAA